MDSWHQGVLAAMSGVSGAVYLILYAEDCMGLVVCQVRPAGNAAEWICFFGMNLVLSSFVITFRHDQQALLEIQRWWTWLMWEIRSCRDGLKGMPTRDEIQKLEMEREAGAIQNVTTDSNGCDPNDATL